MPTPTDADLKARAQSLIEQMAGPAAVLRDDQLTAISALVRDRRRVLLVQRTGWGKSAVYFAATRLVRDAGGGPTLLVSPLLALMRDQIAAAQRIGVHAAAINSANVEEWETVSAAIAADQVDVLLISPERLNAVDFRPILDDLATRVGMLVVDEAHCISDWGHDFRPDYRRLLTLIERLPADVPVLATTATANDRVTADVAAQLGTDPLTLRGTLDRESLRLSVRSFDGAAARLAWLADWVAARDGSGIVYCLTVAQTERVAAWLQSQRIAAAAYSGKAPPEEREQIEQQLKANQLACVVATSALGMGYDKPDLRFVVHLGMPDSPIAYYQAIGRAGRAVERADVVLVPTEADEAIWDYFERTAMPPADQVQVVLSALASAGGPVSTPALERAANLSRGRLDAMLKILDVDGAVRRVRGGWESTGAAWVPDAQRLARVAAARRAEQDAMREYAATSDCLMVFLRRQLDDVSAQPCGRCANCTGFVPDDTPSAATVAEAEAFLRGLDTPLPPRRQWPSGLSGRSGRITPALQAAEGRALAEGRGTGWDAPLDVLLRNGFDPTRDAQALETVVDGLVKVLARWSWERRPEWICVMPSRRHAAAISDVAVRLGELGRLRVHQPLVRDDTGQAYQEDMRNSLHQAGAALAGLRIDGPVPQGPALLIDDVTRSGWTLTAAAALLREAGAELVLPLVLRVER
jgi:ATP-dependent DNA helicase RecQ